MTHIWYVAINWNVWMAVFIIYDNIRGSLKYGTGTFIPVELRHLTIVEGDIRKASRYEAVSFFMLEKLLTAFRKLSNLTSLIDLGCGKGRVLMVAPHFDFVNITGIDFAKELCEAAAFQMKTKTEQFPTITWKILNQDIQTYKVTQDDCVFFMFNPFDQDVLRNFLERVNQSCTKFPRPVYFLYASPRFLKILLDDGYAVVYEKNRMYLRGVIAVRDH
jgi:SAM-dependent methyltransferase